MSQEEKKNEAMANVDKDHENGQVEEDYELLESELATTQRALWDLSSLLEPAEGYQHVTIDGLDYMLLIREGIVFHATEKDLGYRGYKTLLLNDVTIYLWHMVETINENAISLLPSCGPDLRTGGRVAVVHDELGRRISGFEMDVLVPTISSTSLVKIAKCDGSDRRRFRCDYQFTESRLPKNAFDHIVQSLRDLYDCKDAEEGIIRLYDLLTEDRQTACLPKSTPVFEESCARVRPLGRFADTEFFAYWDSIKSNITEKRKRIGTFKCGASRQPKRVKGEEAMTQKEPNLKKLRRATLSMSSKCLCCGLKSEELSRLRKML